MRQDDARPPSAFDLPAMSLSESLDVTKIYSVAGALGNTPHIVTTGPFRAPHHRISHIALVNGGANPKPGGISLAQHGVLYLDEVAEFSRTKSRLNVPFVWGGLGHVKPIPHERTGSVHLRCGPSRSVRAALNTRGQS
jgi:Magnesium chelatase, subunit ChlI